MAENTNEASTKTRKLSVRERFRRASSSTVRRFSMQDDTIDEGTSSNAKRVKKHSAPAHIRDATEIAIGDLIQEEPGIYMGEIEKEDYIPPVPCIIRSLDHHFHSMPSGKEYKYELGGSVTSFVSTGSNKLMKGSPTVSPRPSKKSKLFSTQKNKNSNKSAVGGVSSKGKIGQATGASQDSLNGDAAKMSRPKIGAPRTRKHNVFSLTAPSNLSGNKKKGTESGGSSTTGSGRKRSLTRHPNQRPDRAAPSDSEQAGGGESRGGSSEGAPSEAGDRVQTWATSFEKLLEDPVGLHTFTEFLRKEYSHENIYFWTACERYRLGITADTSGNNNNNNADSNKPWSEWSGKHAAAKTIYNNHLGDNAPEPVNVDAQARQMAHEGLRQPTQDLFAAAQKQVFSLMKFDSYSRFLKSALYEECLEREARGEDIQFGSQESLDPNLMILPSQFQHSSAPDAQNSNNVSLSSDSQHSSYASGLSCVSYGSLDRYGTCMSSERSSPYYSGNADHDDSSVVSSFASNSVINMYDNLSVASSGRGSVGSLFKGRQSSPSPVVSRKPHSKGNAIGNSGLASSSQVEHFCGAKLGFRTASTPEELDSAASVDIPDLKTASVNDLQNNPEVVTDNLQPTPKECTCDSIPDRTNSLRDVPAELNNTPDLCSNSQIVSSLASEIVPGPECVYSVAALSSEVTDRARALNASLVAGPIRFGRENLVASGHLISEVNGLAVILKTAAKGALGPNNCVLEPSSVTACPNSTGEDAATSLRSAPAVTTSCLGSVSSVTAPGLGSVSPVTTSCLGTAPAVTSCLGSVSSVTTSCLGTALAVTAPGLGSVPAVTTTDLCSSCKDSLKINNSAQIRNDHETQQLAPILHGDVTAESTPKSVHHQKQINDGSNFNEKLTVAADAMNLLNLDQDATSREVVLDPDNNKMENVPDSLGKSENQVASPQNSSGIVPSIVVDTQYIKRNPSKISRDSRRVKSMSLPGNDDSDQGIILQHSPPPHSPRLKDYLRGIFDEHFQNIGEHKLGSLSSDQLECASHSENSLASSSPTPPRARARYDSLGLSIADEEQTKRLIESNKIGNLSKPLVSEEPHYASSVKKSYETTSLASVSSQSRRNNFMKTIFGSFRKREKRSAKSRDNSFDRNVQYGSGSAQGGRHLATGEPGRIPSRPYSLDGQIIPDFMNGGSSYLSRRRASPSGHRRNKSSADDSLVESRSSQGAASNGSEVGCPYLANMQRERSFIKQKNAIERERK